MRRMPLLLAYRKHAIQNEFIIYWRDNEYMKSSHNNFIIIYIFLVLSLFSRSAATRRVSVQFTMSSCRISHLPKSWHIHSSEQTLAMSLFGHTFNFSVQDQDMHERENAHRVGLALFFCVTLSHEEPNRCCILNVILFCSRNTPNNVRFAFTYLYIFLVIYLSHCLLVIQPERGLLAVGCD